MEKLNYPVFKMTFYCSCHHIGCKSSDLIGDSYELPHSCIGAFAKFQESFVCASTAFEIVATGAMRVVGASHQ